jgi:hypothetical protein
MERKLVVALTLIFGMAILIGAYYFYNLKNGYELSEKCSKSAKEHFKSTGFDGPFSGYQNHYNSKLNKCFSRVAETTFDKRNDSITNSWWLVDVNENNNIGVFIGRVGEEAPFCHVNNKQCRSLDEWKTLTIPYMEQ